MLEQLLPVALILLALLFRPFLADLLRKGQRAAAQEREPEAPPRLSPLRASPPTPHAGPRGAPLLETPLPDVTRRRARSHLGSLQEVRRGIVLMTILGPCRALESPRPPQ
jgi:hypothetical protein